MSRIISNTAWPRLKAYRERYFVPDLSPEQRSQLADFEPKIVFVAESPHEAETLPSSLTERRPLCGRAGQVFWKMVGELLTGDTSTDTSLPRQLELCRAGRFAVLNAVQFPLDPKITAHRGPECDPVAHLGFCKVPPASFKKLRQGPEVVAAIALLRERLFHESLLRATVVCLGNDAQWFVERALGEEGRARLGPTVPHPSAWWRQGGKLREKARGQLESLLRANRPRSRSAAPARAL